MSDHDDDTPRPDGPQPITAESIPGLARVAATSLLRTSSWALETYARAGRRMADVALHPDRAGEFVDDLRHAAGEVTRALVGEKVEGRVREAAAQNRVTQRVADIVPAKREHDGDRPLFSRAPSATGGHANGAAPRTLPEQGEELLRRSRDVRYEELAHPAYERIMADLAPDEGRILLLLLHRGPQPSVDVRTGGPIGMLSSRLIEPGLNMIGARAGCRYVDRVPSYLNNLHRLGLVWFSRETLRDPAEYQVVEAQPDVLAAMHAVRYTKIVRRSIHLTPFGEDFCRGALAMHTEELAALPAHSPPDEDADAGEPPTPPVA